MGTLHRIAHHKRSNSAYAAFVHCQAQQLLIAAFCQAPECRCSLRHRSFLFEQKHLLLGSPASSARYCGRRRGFLQLPCIQSSTSAGMLPCTAAALSVACTGMMKWYFRAQTG